MADSPLGAAPGDAHSPRGASRPELSTPAGPTSALSPERYLAWLYSPRAQQPVLAALCQIEAEVAASLRPGLDHHVAHARLQWWRDECERAAQGRPAHPLTRELVRAFGGRAAAGPTSSGANGDAGSRSAHASSGGIGNAANGTATASSAAISNAANRTTTASSAPVSNAANRTTTASSAPISNAPVGVAASAIAGISGFVDTAVWDLAGATFETRKELTAYCERWSVAMFGAAAANSWSEADHAARAVRVAEQAAAESAGVRDATGASLAPGTLRVRALGAAVREIELLAGLAREAHAGRLRVPLDELEGASVDVSSLAKAPWPAALVNLLRERHEALREILSKGVSQLRGDEQAPIRGLLVWAALAWRLSRRAQRALPNIILPRRYHALADGWHAWRAAHRASAGRLRLTF